MSFCDNNNSSSPVSSFRKPESEIPTLSKNIKSYKTKCGICDGFKT
jgi:hypothetical protein